MKRLLYKARREMKKALDEVEGVEFTDEEVELLESEYEAVQGMLRLFDAALRAKPGINLDAELVELEERRQWGEYCPVCGRAWADFSDDPSVHEGDCTSY